MLVSFHFLQIQLDTSNKSEHDTGNLQKEKVVSIRLLPLLNDS